MTLTEHYTLTERYPVTRIHGRSRHRSAIEHFSSFTRRRPLSPDYRVTPLRIRYATAAWGHGGALVPSTVIQALTLGSWLGFALEIGATLLALLGLGWMLRRIKHPA